MDANERGSSPNDAPVRKSIVPSGRLLGHLDSFRHHPLTTVMSMMDRGEDISRLRVGFQSMFLLFDPALIREVLMDDKRRFTKTTRGYEKLRILLGNGLVTSGGDFWLRQRRIAQPAFRRQCIHGFAAIMQGAVDDLCESWRLAASPGSPVNIVEASYILTLKIAGDTLMSVDMTGEGRIVGESMALVMERFNHIVASPLPWPEYWPTPANYRLWKAVFTLRTLTDSIIDKRRKSGAKISDLLGMLMAASDPETGETMNDRQLRDEVLTMLLAGHDTSANALIWSVYLIAQHPDVGARLESEIDEAWLGGRPGIEALYGCVYLRQVINETLRLYPPVWTVGRQAAESTSVGGYEIPKGSYLMISPYAMHRHPRFWDRPNIFDPGRFGSEADDPDRFVYLPFIRGRRQCIGDRFAEMELIIALATLLRRFRFTLVPDQHIEIDPSVTLRTNGPVFMKIQPRA